MQQENVSLPPEILSQLDELSDVWRELLGARTSNKPVRATSPSDGPIPTLDVDPWSTLLQAHGVEVVELQHMHLQISDQEVEQILQVMRDTPDNRDNPSSDKGRNS